MYKFNKTYMSNPYYWDFPQRADTMYMSTIQNKFREARKSPRESIFLMKDIDGSYPKKQIPDEVRRQNYNYSTYIEPRPQYARSVKKISNPLYTKDIEGSFPQASLFSTNRVVNPLVPRYKLPTHNPIDVEPPNKFLRNTLDISDIVSKKKQYQLIQSPKQQKVQGSQPARLFKTIEAVSRLEVKDINNDGKFVSDRLKNPTDPLNPVYHWRDSTEKNVGFSFTKPTLTQQYKTLNTLYGTIDGTVSKRLIPIEGRRQSSSLNTKNVEGAHANSFNQSRFFLDKRTEFRNYMKTDDIDKSHASSLKKGITTRRSVNPLMPNYKYPQ